MTKEQEELQLKEFFKRAEVRTMKKDLLKLREADALQEKAKITSKIKEIAKPQNPALQPAPAEKIETKTAVEEVLQKTTQQETDAKKQLKNFALEEEKQQIFALESQKQELQKQIENLKNAREPQLLMDENKLKIDKEKIKERLKLILGQEEKLESEIKFITEGEKQATDQKEKKGLEEKRWKAEDSRKDTEKKRWEAEKELAEKEIEIEKIEKNEAIITAEENELQKKIAEIEENLKRIYSGIIVRDEAIKSGKEAVQKERDAKIADIQSQEKEKIQREQYTSPNAPPKEKEFMKTVSEKIKNKIAQMAQKEEEQRKKFLKDVEEQSKE